MPIIFTFSIDSPPKAEPAIDQKKVNKLSLFLIKKLLIIKFKKKLNTHLNSTLNCNKAHQSIYSRLIICI